jgi:hypothetical protein
MAQVWVPIEALTGGKLPPVCLITGETHGVALRELSLRWVSSTGGLGRANHLDTAVVRSALSSSPILAARVPLTDEGERRYAMSRQTGLVFVGGLSAPTIFFGALGGGPGAAFGLCLGVAAAIAYAVYFGRGTGIGLLRRSGDEVLLEVENDRAAAALSDSFPKSG